MTQGLTNLATVDVQTEWVAGARVFCVCDIGGPLLYCHLGVYANCCKVMHWDRTGTEALNGALTLRGGGRLALESLWFEPNVFMACQSVISLGWCRARRRLA